MMKYRKTFRDAWDETKLRSVNEQEENQDSDEIKKLKDEIQQWKLKYQQAKIDKSAPQPNKDTGEVPLRTGIGSALLDKEGPTPKIQKSKKEKVKLSSGKSKIEINPDVDIGVFSGGNKVNTGTLH